MAEKNSTTFVGASPKTQSRPFSSFQTGQSCATMASGSTTLSPADCHALGLAKMIFDEQFLQGVLSAAFTIQEYNDRRKVARRQTPAEPEVRPEPEAEDLGALMPDPSLLVLPVAQEVAPETIRQQKSETVHDRAFNTSALDKAEAKCQWITEATEDFRREHLASELTIEPFQLPASDDVRTDAPADARIEASRTSTELLNFVPNHLLQEIVQETLQATRATGAAIAIKQQGELICRAAEGDFASEIGTMINTRSGFTGVCTSSGTMQFCSNAALDSRVGADACRKLGVGAIIVVPLLHQDQLLGLITAFSRRPYAFGMRDLQALQDLADKFAANLQLSAESRQTPLTGHERPGAFNFSFQQPSR
jgi:GAF domain-containing protein